MHAIGKKVTSTTGPEMQTKQRRAFFIQLAGGILGGWIAGNLFMAKRISGNMTESNNDIRVTVHPLAVPRKPKEQLSHGE